MLSIQEIKTYNNGFKTTYTRDALGNLLGGVSSNGFWFTYKRDCNGREMHFEDSTGVWRAYSNNFLRYDDSSGKWYEYESDAYGFKTTYKDSSGFVGVAIAHDEHYTLFYDKNKNHLKAGCRYFTDIDKAISHWSDNTLRSVTFKQAIEKIKLQQ